MFHQKLHSAYDYNPNDFTGVKA